MFNLYQLKNQYLDTLNEFYDSIDLETGEVSVDLAQKMSEISATFEEKAMSTGYVVLMLENELSNIDKLIDRLKKQKAVIENNKKRLKDSLSNALLSAGYSEIKGDYGRISFRESESTVIDDESALSEDMFTVKVEKKPSLTAIKQAIKQAEANGEVFVGAHIEKNKHIQIK